MDPIALLKLTSTVCRYHNCLSEFADLRHLWFVIEKDHELIVELRNAKYARRHTLHLIQFCRHRRHVSGTSDETFRDAFTPIPGSVQLAYNIFVMREAKKPLVWAILNLLATCVHFKINLHYGFGEVVETFTGDLEWPFHGDNVVCPSVHRREIWVRLLDSRLHELCPPFIPIELQNSAVKIRQVRSRSSNVFQQV